MSQDVIPAQVNKEICEAVGCNAEATAKIDIQVGQSRMITLYLCSDCVYKFAED